MPSLSTSFRYLISISILSLMLSPLAFGYSLISYWDYIDGLFRSLSLVVFVVGYFAQMCGLVVLRHLEAAQGISSVEKDTEDTVDQSGKRDTSDEQRGGVEDAIFIFLLLLGFVALIITFSKG